ncbi:MULTISPECIES: carbohydrate ABC transporter permease [unclassified Streptomyces]|uniref:carbohydrate ABC transporter permease n=1 Tax=unclassified Streptomyces TaxID=2593676 RepID=UPI00031B60CC|nr:MULTISPECIES: sugar ABC transporter permease [unclassified Streptomyces]NJA60110.1 sugar ABC transporter permease [Streptomyces sp. NEAU-H3]WEH30644.1 sugar ABC transporter permease [Streptomyces sp. AM 3-1-1]
MSPTSPPAAPLAPGRRRGPLDSPRLLWLTVPSLVWFAVFSVGPLVAMFVIATLEWKGLIYEPHYTGTENIRHVLGDDVFLDALRNSAVQIAVVLPVMIPLAFMLGHHLSTRPRGYRVLSVLYFSPGLISISVTGMIFYGVLSPDGGANGLLRATGLDALTHSWLADPGTALPAVIAIDLWRGIGWTAVLFASRLSSVPGEVVEAARLDGAGTFRVMWQITFPMVKDYVRTLTMLQFLWTLFTSAALVLLLTKGGPGSSSTTLSYLVYEKAFAQSDLGYSQVVGVVLLLLGVAGMLLIHRLLRDRDPGEQTR